ncbi:MAG: UDP-N-acetylmuramate: L-alanyl-gamma-D-glutamyl-meso-diaminopimelate ligase [Pseudohongiellaceae bacterium]|jgi:UDP-N-acetylmuramate: L-alanyl-gamma-D-glutamyl-meso-diaminopimelate ligase
MHIHILGICGTFMGSLAVLAREVGLKVTGCDQSVYPPMSTQLEEQGIGLISGYDLSQLDLGADLYVIGNAISRGNPLLEEILNQGLPYTSGPGLLADKILPGKWVLGVSGTHGKTTTSSMLAWILEYAGMKPGFLIGGVPGNFGYSARLGDTPFFVIEADEYDSAFFDKRSKFVHYRPRTFIVNNLEFDHADIFSDLAAIQTQFHHVIRTIPSNGRVIYPAKVEAIDQVLAKGCWAEKQYFSEKSQDSTEKDESPVWRQLNASGSEFQVMLEDDTQTVNWSLTGKHNVENGMAAMLAARHVGVTLAHSAEALSCFKGVKRRMECLANIKTTCGVVSIYDDFAHHPTAIKTTLDGLRRHVGKANIIALIEPRSNTMKMGVHAKTLLASAEQADHVIWADLTPSDSQENTSGVENWLESQIHAANETHVLGKSVEVLIEQTMAHVRGETHIVIMSNGGFSGIHQQLIDAVTLTLGGVNV